MILVLGLGITKIEKIFVKTYIRDRLVKCETLFNIINKNNLQEMKKILELKKKNLNLLTNNNDNINYQYSLRK